MWTKGYSIFVFHSGSVYNASGIAIDEDINNFFETEDQAWKMLQSLSGLSRDLVFTILPVMKFVQ